MPIPIAAGMSTVHHPTYKDEYGNVWVDTPAGKHIKGSNEPLDGFYVGYSSNDGVRFNVNGVGNYVPNGFTMARNIPQNRGYSRNVAATAKDISQGGMTKDEVQQWNIAHPNETAWRNE